MLKLSKKVDYGLMAISHIAHQETGTMVNAREIAELFDIPPELLAKVLQRLAKQGLIQSQNGPKGGYGLARNPAEITVREVISAIDGPVEMADCHKGYGCDQLVKCTVREPIRRIQDSISSVLENMTVSELARLH